MEPQEGAPPQHRHPFEGPVASRAAAATENKISQPRTVQLRTATAVDNLKLMTRYGTEDEADALLDAVLPCTEHDNDGLTKVVLLQTA